MRGGALGDFILTLPAITAMLLAHPQCHLHVIGRPSFARLAQAHRITDGDSPHLVPIFTSTCGPIPLATRRVFESSAAALAYVAEDDGASLRRLRTILPGSLVGGDPRPDPTSRGHIIEHLLAPVRAAGIAVSDPLPRVHPYEGEKESELAGDGPYVAIHPGSGGAKKSWPINRFAELGRALTATGQRPVYLCGPIERERPDTLAAFADSKVITPDLRDLPTVLRGAQLFIGNDSGPGHLAAAVGTRTLSLFGPTDSAVWRPIGEGCEVVEAPHGELAQLTVKTILDRALEMLSNR